jgi:hypothetical protein
MAGPNAPIENWVFRNGYWLSTGFNNQQPFFDLKFSILGPLPGSRDKSLSFAGKFFISENWCFLQYFGGRPEQTI